MRRQFFAFAVLAFVFAAAAGQAQEGCFGAGQPLFHCQAGAKVVDICLQDDVVLYQFGPRNGAAEMLLAQPVARVDMTPWAGIGRYLSEDVTLANGDVLYMVRYSIDRLAESGPSVDASVSVFQGGRMLAEVVCDPGRVTVSDFYPVYEAKERVGQCWNREAGFWGRC